MSFYMPQMYLISFNVSILEGKCSEFAPDLGLLQTNERTEAAKQAQVFWLDDFYGFLLGDL